MRGKLIVKLSKKIALAKKKLREQKKSKNTRQEVLYEK